MHFISAPGRSMTKTQTVLPPNALGMATGSPALPPPSAGIGGDKRPHASEPVPGPNGRFSAWEAAGRVVRSTWSGIWLGLLMGLPMLPVGALNAGPPDSLAPDQNRSREVHEAETNEGAHEATNGPSSSPGKAVRRLPRFFGKLDLAAEQREKIFTIQEQYQQQIERLELELVELRIERESQVREILSEEQRVRLDRFMEEPRTPVRRKESAPNANETDPKPSVATSVTSQERS